MSTTVSPLAPKSYPEMPAIDGVRIATAEAGIKYKNRTDVLLMVFDEPAPRSPASSPARNARRRRSIGAARTSPAARRALLVVNSGNANAFTGKKGRDDDRR